MLLSGMFVLLPQGAVTDLICGATGPRPLHLRKGQFCDVEDPALRVRIESHAHLLQLLRRGIRNRTACATAMNHVSSRSHCVFVVHRFASSRVSGETTSAAKMYSVWMQAF